MHYSPKRGLAIACRLSVSPSVRLYVTLVDCDHIGWKSWKLTTQTELTSSGDELATSLATVVQTLSSSVRNTLEDMIAFSIKSSALAEFIFITSHTYYAFSTVAM